MRIKSLLFILLLTASAAANELAIVKKISDGDTIAVISGGRSLIIRLIGIDAPESRKNQKALKNSNRSETDIDVIISQGRKATAFVKSILHKGDTVYLAFDSGRNDKYGRTLAYVYLSDGRMLNDVIIGSGYASPLTIPPNVKYKDLFLKSYKAAREKKIGLWADN